MIEILDLSEDQSIRFFARLHEHQKNTDELNAERMILLDKIERLVRNKVDPEQYLEMFTEIDAVDEKLFRDRRAFGEGLHEILSEEQCAKLLLFERQFQKELKDALLQSQKQGEE